MFEIAPFVLSAGFGVALVILFGERGYVVDLRSRKGRRSPITGGRRSLDPIR